MDSLINAAARALAAGDPLGALKRVALREDPPALALRGIAMAQLGDLTRAKSLLRAAVRAFGQKDTVARARCVVAEAEIALASRDLGGCGKELSAARAVLEAHGDRLNAAYARSIQIRRLLLIGNFEEAERMLEDFDAAALPPAWRAVYELVIAGIAMRRIRAKQARSALARANRAAKLAGISGLIAEVEGAARMLDAPAARCISRGTERLVSLDDVEALLAALEEAASGTLVIDACRYAVRRSSIVVSLARRPVLFALARALAEAWPEVATRQALLEKAFGAKFADESHRARLRVEIGRLRKMLRNVAGVNASGAGFVLAPGQAGEVVVLAQPVEDKNAALLALLAAGECWSSSALAIALGTSQRTILRALDTLAKDGKAQWAGRGRARRWMTPPVPGFSGPLLLPTRPPIV